MVFEILWLQTNVPRYGKELMRREARPGFGVLVCGCVSCFFGFVWNWAGLDSIGLD